MLRLSASALIAPDSGTAILGETWPLPYLRHDTPQQHLLGLVGRLEGVLIWCVNRGVLVILGERWSLLYLRHDILQPHLIGLVGRLEGVLIGCVDRVC